MAPTPDSHVPGPRRALVHAGVADLTRAERLLSSPELAEQDADAALAALAHAADPDSALLLYIRLAERDPQVHRVLAEADRARDLLRLLGASEALGEFLIRRPEHLDLVLDPARAAATAPALAQQDPTDGGDWHDEPAALRALLLEAVGADPAADQPVAGLTGADASVALRRAYRRQLTAIALADLASREPTLVMPAVGRWLADLAGAALEAALAVSRAELRAREGAAVDCVELAVIGMGKCGARELNYVSDVDVVFVHDVLEPGAPDAPSAQEAARLAAELAAGISRVLSGPAPEPGLWEVDANLRPEGRDGALSRTLDSHVEYYRRWAHGWEFQALLKARPVAGSPALGERYVAAVWPRVWESSAREGFVENVRAMRTRVLDTIARDERDREIKLGAGGLRDVEFTAQLVQLVHGRADESVRVRGTLDALRVLHAASYISSRDMRAFDAAYRWLRLLEHRIQLVHLRRTHLMPVKEGPRRVVARSMRGAGDVHPVAGDDLQDRFSRVRREVRALHETVFYRPLLSTTAALSDEDVRLSADAVQARLSALGYRDPRRALAHIEALTRGVSRRAAVQRQLLPAMLGWFADGADPDAGLLAFRRLSESLGSSPWFLRMLRDSTDAARRLCLVLAGSRRVGDLLEHAPESVAWIGETRELAPRGLSALTSEVTARLDRRSPEESAAQVIRHVRQIRQREILRTALADITGVVGLEEVGHALADVDQAAVQGALRVAGQAVLDGADPLTEVVVVAMGRQGGREIAYGSDLDAMFVHRPLAGADETAAAAQAEAVARQLMALLQQPAAPPLPSEQPLDVDADLRPEGRQGPLVRTLDSYREYYARWAEVWERQALLRARVVAGPAGLAEEFTAWADGVRYGDELSAGDAREIRRIKARVEAERLPRGADPARHVKLGRGGLSDVEWLVQSLQLRHAHDEPELRVTGTLPALRALARLDLLPPSEAALLEEAWLLATRVRSALVLWTGKGSDVLPTNARDLGALARLAGDACGGGVAFEERYLRVTRQARQVFEQRFYGL
ncbi:bifunctional [glutamine synthetase] adenylyltransferase/[glutamine synthetase]-adenylyl-L-tyrosine phosphorylase [Micrococcus porci]|uniref:bifunctional [glutamine synthetase] adenylyltransferase/[glutamine synthetase]-adenylyl-L-tyrosine phosphorylase n=1 Tax=Micrococcus porci TaxID=2856555 RepID=UPI001CCE8E73|nr:bifunctional [glutamine synthetase] adenylyltransferase/[glutamine synthetase]-adenylyl-L-tyrosine phosphorylase [Micrococcus porci]UBH23709.1 bifunctional [glutamine synthetase] adenylyltransferase/[glutamine synthetase]-adenylyl-L-tyrosine phosphorylase [Micrococcus porci]